MKFLGPYFLVSCLTLAPASSLAEHGWPGDPEPSRPNGEQMASLSTGEVLVENIVAADYGSGARVQALFKAPPEVIWGFLESCEHNFRFVEGLEDCQVIEIDTHYARTRQVIKKNWFTPHMEYTFEAVREPHSVMQFRLVEGDLSKMDGSWRFEPVEDSEDTLVTHELLVQPKWSFPRWLIRRTLIKDLPDMVGCLRSIANASGSEEQLLADRRRCPE